MARSKRNQSSGIRDFIIATEGNEFDPQAGGDEITQGEDDVRLQPVLDRVDDRIAIDEDVPEQAEAVALDDPRRVDIAVERAGFYEVFIGSKII